MSSASPKAQVVALFAALITSAAAAPNAEAKQHGMVRGEVIIILAKEEAGEIDDDLGQMPALRRPPFNAFRSMEILQRPRLSLTPGESQDIELPNGRRLRIQLQGQTPDGRYRARVSINRPGESDYLPLLSVAASAGDPFFVAGQEHRGGTLVIGIRLGL